MVCPVMTGPMCGYKHGKHHQVWENDWVYSFNMSPEHPNPKRGAVCMTFGPQSPQSDGQEVDRQEWLKY